nr:alkaline phosphatase family protein [Streptomyces acidipaludis]
MTGTIDPDGLAGGPALDNGAAKNTYSWTTYPERLEAAGVSWKIYHEPSSGPGGGPTGLAVIANMRQCQAAKPGSPLIPGGNLPVGLGFRVPCVIISPWTVGGWVASETFDHTSVLQFLERVTGVAEPNISEWRRRVTGDLTSALRMSEPRRSAPDLPQTGSRYNLAQYQAAHLPLPTVPARQTAPRQERGHRPRT